MTRRNHTNILYDQHISPGEMHLIKLNVLPTNDETCSRSYNATLLDRAHRKRHQRIVLMIVGALDCVSKSSFSNLRDVVTFFEKELMQVVIHLYVEVNGKRLLYDHMVTGTNGYVNDGGQRTITSQHNRRRLLQTSADDKVFQMPLDQLEYLRLAWGNRVASWNVHTSLSLDNYTRDFPNLHLYKACSWPSPLNGILLQFKLLLAAQSATYCPNDIVVRLRPNSAVELDLSWPQIHMDECEFFSPLDSAGGVGVNDNFAIMTVGAWQRVASMYLNFDRMYRKRSCFHNEVFLMYMLNGVCRRSLETLDISIKACRSFTTYATAFLKVQQSNGIEHKRALTKE